MTSLFELPVYRESIPLNPIQYGAQSISAIEFFAIEEEEKHDTFSEDAAASAAQLAHDRAQQINVMLDAARCESRAQAIKDCEAEMQERLEVERERVRHAWAAFAQDRQRYFDAAEAQVVKLALAVAQRILAREVRPHAMHLESVVRAALARVRDGSECVVRVHSNSVTAWDAVFSAADSRAVRIVADSRLAEQECVVETEVGRVELGVQAQIDEIERGFRELTRRQVS